MANEDRTRGGWLDDDENDRMRRPSGGGLVRSSSIAYESGRPRNYRRRFLTIAFIVVIVGGSAAIVWNAYNQGQRTNGDGVVPLIQADNSPSKVKPDQPGGMDVPNQDKLIYDRLTPGQSSPNSVERLLPPAEQPVARPQEPPPAPSQDIESMLPEVAAIPETPPPAQVPRPAVQPPANEFTPPTIAPRQPVASVPSAPQSAPKPPPVVASNTPAANAAAGRNFRVQLGAVRAPDVATKEWERLVGANKDLLGKLTLNVTQADLGERGTFYRIQAGPVGDQQAALDLCAKLKTRNVSCIIVRQ